MVKRKGRERTIELKIRAQVPWKLCFLNYYESRTIPKTCKIMFSMIRIGMLGKLLELIFNLVLGSWFVERIWEQK